MRLQHVTVENCASCPTVSADVRGHLVVVGANEAGKSTLLRLLDATLSWSHGRLLNELPVTVIADSTKPLVVEVTLVELDDEAQSVFADEIEVLADSEFRLTIRMEVSTSEQDPDTIEVQRDFVKDGVRPIRLLQRHLPYLRWTHLRASRSADRELGRARSGTVRTLLESVDLETDREAIVEAIGLVNERIAAATSIESLRGDIAAALSEVYPRQVAPANVSVQLPSTHDPLGDVDVRLAHGDGEAASLLDQSDGIRSLSVMSLQLLVRGGVTITAVDEPEVHLHPRSQARVARLLAEKPGQRIVATHAPAVVRAFKPSEVLALTPTGARQLPAGAIEADAKFFSQWWVDAMLEPLTARGAILVEGVSDEALVRAVARLKAVDLDREGISVVALGSANNFPNALKLFGPSGFDLPLAALVDEKEAHLPADALEVGIDDLAAHGVFVARPDLEAEYCNALGADRLLDALTESELFTEAQILKATGCSDKGEVTLESLQAFCSAAKRKVKASIAVSGALNDQDLPALTVVPDVVDFVCGL